MNRKKISTIRIGNKLVGGNQPVFVIAEAGVNHNGRLDSALKLIDAAAAAGADAVKFQTFQAEQVVTESGQMAEYQKRNIGKTGSQLAMLKKLELKESYYPKLILRARKRGIIFLSTPHGGFQSVDFLKKVSLPAFKFGSGDLTNIPLLQYAARLKKPMIISTGMATMPEIQKAVRSIRQAGNEQLVVLQCTTDYPCSLEEANIRAMQTIARQTGAVVGFSDHTVGFEAAIAAVTLGASVVEKHLTLDRRMTGPDHAASADAGEFREFVIRIRSVSRVLGSDIKRPTPNELRHRLIARKSLVANAAIKKGEKFSPLNIAIKRPGTGLPPEYFLKLMGRTARRDISKDSLISKNHYA